MDDAPLPESLTLDGAFRAAYFMTDQYLALESNPDTALVLFWQYLKSDPARWEDWKDSVRRALDPTTETDLLRWNLDRGE